MGAGPECGHACERHLPAESGLALPRALGKSPGHTAPPLHHQNGDKNTCSVGLGFVQLPHAGRGALLMLTTGVGLPETGHQRPRAASAPAVSAALCSGAGGGGGADPPEPMGTVCREEGGCECARRQHPGAPGDSAPRPGPLRDSAGLRAADTDGRCRAVSSTPGASGPSGFPEARWEAAVWVRVPLLLGAPLGWDNRRTPASQGRFRPDQNPKCCKSNSQTCILSLKPIPIFTTP